MPTVINKPTFSVDGWTANVVADDGTDWFCNQMDGWFEPLGVRSFDIERPIGDGTYSSPSLRTPRVITLGGLGEATSYAAIYDQMDLFASLMSGGDELHELVVVEDFRTLTAMVKLAPNPKLVPVNSKQFDWQLILVAPDPRKYGPYPVTPLTTGLGTPPTGGILWGGSAGSTGVEWAGPSGGAGVIWQTGSGVPGIVTVTNNGTAPAPLKFVITDTAEDLYNPSILCVETGERITYGGIMPANSTLEIDADPESPSVLLDGSNRGPSLSQTEFFMVPRKSTIHILFSSTAPAPGASLAVLARDTYI